MVQSPMLSCPLKQTNEIDWVQPLKDYIRQTYGEDPERYSQECVTLNRLRQDMRGAGKDSATGRDLLYRYYGQLELLDLRFPVDENHIKISFTWYVFRASSNITCANQSCHSQVRRVYSEAYFSIFAGLRKGIYHLQHIRCPFLPCRQPELGGRHRCQDCISLLPGICWNVYLYK